jgi:hypothetical protein
MDRWDWVQEAIEEATLMALYPDRVIEGDEAEALQNERFREVHRLMDLLESMPLSGGLKSLYRGPGGKMLSSQDLKNLKHLKRIERGDICPGGRL